MADITLHDGREITFNLDALSMREFRALVRPEQTDAEEYAMLAKVSGLTPDDVADLPMLEYRRFAKAFITKATEPLADPN